MLIAVPSDAPGGLDALVSDHFGHSDLFTLVQVDGETLGEVTILKNQEHAQGGCMAPVMVLKEKGVEAIVVGGIGGRPLAGFQQVGISVFHKGETSTVREAVQGVIAGSCRELGAEHVCGGHGGHCGHDHEHHGPRPGAVVDGPVAGGRFVELSYRLSDEAGTLLDEADAIGYLHGADQVVLGFERALEGHVAGESVSVTVAPADGYGERDEGRMVSVPLANLPPGVTAGMTLGAELPNGAPIELTVVKLDKDTATLDGNHPLAGKTLRFEVKLLAVREAIEGE